MDLYYALTLFWLNTIEPLLVYDTKKYQYTVEPLPVLSSKF